MAADHAASRYGMDALNSLAAPLREVQHQYRYIRAVQSEHGWTPAVLEGVGALAGAAGGTLLAGPEGGMLGAEAAMGAEARIFYPHLWDATVHTYTDKTGRQITLGGDLVYAEGKIL